jgi:hypothetical protein
MRVGMRVIEKLCVSDRSDDWILDKPDNSLALEILRVLKHAPGISREVLGSFDDLRAPPRDLLEVRGPYYVRQVVACARTLCLQQSRSYAQVVDPLTLRAHQTLCYQISFHSKAYRPATSRVPRARGLTLQSIPTIIPCLERNMIRHSTIKPIPIYPIVHRDKLPT